MAAATPPAPPGSRALSPPRGHSMDDQFFQQGLRFIEEAVREDNAGNFARALNLYSSGLRYFMMKLKYEKNPAVKEILRERVKGYMDRAEQLKEHVARSAPAAGDGGAAAGGGEHGQSRAAPAAAEHIDVEAELAKIVGQEDIKTLLRSMRHEMRLDMRRRELGFALAQLHAPHCIFAGNPGTGKTSIARLVAASLFELGIIERNVLVEVQRADLVAGHIGQTAPKTRARIDEARGGVLFVDEAYRLVSTSKQDFGAEAINELMAAMSSGDPVMIFAGYEEEMRAFIESNPGMFRRVEYQFHFANYTCNELARILMLKVRGSGFNVAANVDEAALTDVIERYTSPRQRALMNGGLAASVLRRAKRALDSRLTADCAVEQLCTYELHDFETATQGLPEPPPPPRDMAPHVGGASAVVVD